MTSTSSARATALVSLAVWLCVTGAQGFNPPEDKAGPITARIEGPARVTATETPLPVQVILENESDNPVQGTVRVQVIDPWRAEPADPAPFTVVGKGETSLRFTVTAGQGTYNALYPVHAFVEFGDRAARTVVHPVLIVETLLPDVPRPRREVEWRPIDVPANGSLALLRLPVFRAMIQVFGEAPQVMDPGWYGADGRTRASVYPSTSAARPDARPALGIHPPWYQGLAGTLLAEYPLRLPEGLPVTLRFANAIRDNAATEPPSDGVTFRVRAVPSDAPDGTFGEVVFERNTDTKTWQDENVDLSRFAGQTIRLQLECHPGPKNDTTCDQAYWAEPVITAGVVSPPVPLDHSREIRLGSWRQDGHEGEVRVRLGRRGLLDGEVVFTLDAKTLSFRGLHVRVLGDSLEESGGVAELREVVENETKRGCMVRHVFRRGSTEFELVGKLYVPEEVPALRAEFRIEKAPPPQPWSVVYMEDLAAGPWSERAAQVYAGVGNVIRDPQAFELGFDGHQLSTSFVGFDFADGISMVQGVDVPPNKLEVTPDKRIYTLHAPIAPTLTFIPCANVWDGVGVWRRYVKDAASGVRGLAGRFVFDLWGGRYASSARALQQASLLYGLTHSLVVWHNWQRWGYDYRLPDIYPPNPDYGTIEEFQQLAKSCRECGMLFAPHDNYIDLYPDAEGFSYKNVAFTPDGEPVRAWFNEGRQAQAYRWNTAEYRPFMERNLKLIRDNIAPTAYFIDVWSSIGPYESWTYDGRFQDRVFTRNIWGETFAWIRAWLGRDAPQISESGHDQLVGFLDGGQTNHLRVDPNPPKGGEWLTWRIRCADAERIPWFDAAYHDRFVAHGAGYPGRYQGGLDDALHGIYSDDYISTEVMTGHPPMASQPFGRNVVRKYWLQHGLAQALFHARRVKKVEFVDGDLHRQHIIWDLAEPGNAAETWINRGDRDWTVDPPVFPDHGPQVLPPYGFYAAVKARTGDAYDSCEAGITRKDGVITEWSYATEGTWAGYFNARPVVDDRLAVRVALDALRYLGERKLEVSFRWEADRPLADAVTPFVHFVDEGGKILFQADHQFALPTTQWQGAMTSSAVTEIPPVLQPGDTVELRVGLWRPDLGLLSIQGTADPERRIRLGTLKLEGENGRIARVAWTPLASGPDPVLARLNPEKKMIVFGNIATDGACRITREGEAVIVMPLPEGPAFTVRIKKAMFWPDEKTLPTQAECRAEDRSIVRAVPLKTEGDVLALACDPGVFAYRLASEGKP